MQSDNQPKPELDDDILQCRLDLQRALQAAKRTPPQAAETGTKKEISPIRPLQSSQTSDSDQPELDLEPELPTPQVQKPAKSPVGIHILPFETLYKKTNPESDTPDPLSASIDTPDNSPPPESVENLKDEHRRQLAALQEQLGTKTSQWDEMLKKNRQLQQNLDVSLQSTEDKQKQIESLEQDLAEKISRISELQQKIDEKTAALATHADQLRHAADEKEAAKKHLDAMTLEWTQTIDDLKTAQKGAAQILQRRQSEIEALKEELAGANQRLDQADTANATLKRENAELLETLEETRRQAQHYQEALSEINMDIEEDADLEEQPPEPYCEPIGDVISEDDVHLEQKLTEHEIPSFSLAEQIMAEQRKASTARRQGPESNRETTSDKSIEYVLRQYVSEPQNPASTSPLPQPLETSSDRFLRWQGESLTDYQESLLSDIIQKDIRRFCGMDLHLTAWHRPKDN